MSCFWNLYLDVVRNGELRLSRPDPSEMDPDASCCLDVVEGGVCSEAEIAEILGVEEEEVSATIRDALRQLRRYQLVDPVRSHFVSAL